MSLGDKANAESATMRLGMGMFVCGVARAGGAFSLPFSNSKSLFRFEAFQIVGLQPCPVLQPHNTEICRLHQQEQTVQCCENHSNCNTMIHHCVDIGSSRASHLEPQDTAESSTCDGICSESLSIVLLCLEPETN